jgi:hypothetical protein
MGGKAPTQKEQENKKGPAIAGPFANVLLARSAS